jgi:hypothetical protein
MNMSWFNNNGTATHTHEFQNFKSNAGKIMTLQGPSVMLKGIMDVGTNHPHNLEECSNYNQY